MTPKLKWTNLKLFPHIWKASYQPGVTPIALWLSEDYDREWHAEVIWVRCDSENMTCHVSIVDEKLDGVRDAVDAMVKCEQRVREVLTAEFGELLK